MAPSGQQMTCPGDGITVYVNGAVISNWYELHLDGVIAGARTLANGPSLAVGDAFDEGIYQVMEYQANGVTQIGYISNNMVLSHHPGLSAGVASADQTICFTETPSQLTATPPTGGTPPYSYQWQRFNETIWNDIPGATDLYYQPPIMLETVSYRLVQSSGNCTGITNSVTITVHGLMVAGTASTDHCLCPWESPSLVVASPPSGGSGSFSYQWQEYDGANWNDIPGATDLTYQPPELTEPVTYRLLQTDDNCTAFSEVITNPATIDLLTCISPTRVETVPYSHWAVGIAIFLIVMVVVVRLRKLG